MSISEANKELDALANQPKYNKVVNYKPTKGATSKYQPDGWPEDYIDDDNAIRWDNLGDW